MKEGHYLSEVCLENQSLMMQVAELRKVVEAAKVSIASWIKNEYDDILRDIMKITLTHLESLEKPN